MQNSFIPFEKVFNFLGLRIWTITDAVVGAPDRGELAVVVCGAEREIGSERVPPKRDTHCLFLIGAHQTYCFFKIMWILQFNIHPKVLHETGGKQLLLPMLGHWISPAE